MVEQLAYIQRVGGSVPSVPTRLVPPINGTILTHTYFHKCLAGTAGRFLLEKKMYIRDVEGAEKEFRPAAGVPA